MWPNGAPMSTKKHVLALLPVYALGCLDNDEAQLVSNHIRCCPDCQAELRAYQAVVDALALAIPLIEPPPDLKTRLLRRIAQQSEAQRAKQNQ